MDEAIPALPEAIAEMVGSARAFRVTAGDSRARVFQLDNGHYLKLARRDSGDPASPGLRGERDRLNWLRGRLPVPEVRAFAEDATDAYLLMTELPGRNAAPGIGRAGLPWLIETLAEASRKLHSLPPGGCPFDASVERLIETARLRMERGLVDEGDFDEPRRGRSARELFDELVATRPRDEDEDRVFTHGDLCLPNVVVRDRALSGFVDLGAAGVGDRWRDLALVTRSIGRNLGEGWEAGFLEAYGINPHPDKIRFFRSLDEFF